LIFGCQEVAVNRRWWIRGDGMEDIWFKRVPQGWRFIAPSPFRTYIVTDSQKVELTRRLHWMQRIVLLIFIVAVLILVPLVASHRLSIERSAVGLGIVLIIALDTCVIWMQSHLSPTTTSSTRTILFFGMISLALTAGSVDLGFTSGWDPTTTASAVLFGSGTLDSFLLLLAKRRMR
jgi:hypothetical protein